MEYITKAVGRAIERDVRRTMRREEKSRKEEKRSLALHKGLTKEVQVGREDCNRKGSHTATRKAKQTPSTWLNTSLEELTSIRDTLIRDLMRLLNQQQSSLMLSPKVLWSIRRGNLLRTH